VVILIVKSAGYLLYGRFYLPTGRLDALYSTRISPTLQAVFAAISDPRAHVQSERKGKTDNPSNLMLSLQHDIGSWCTEYTWSAEDSMWGIRALYNFATPAKLAEHGEEGERIASKTTTRPKRVDEEDAAEAGLRGRVSVGAELYVSTTERSAGGQ
jgi:distribution and morphology protein 10